MIRVLLMCGAGMSTSILVRKMKEADTNQEFSISCTDTNQAHIAMLKSDVFLLAPHVSYLKDEYKNLCDAINLPFMIIDTLDYTRMDGMAVLEKVSLLYQNHLKEHHFKLVLLHSEGGIMSDLLSIEIKKQLKLLDRDWDVSSVGIEKFIDDGNVSLVLLEPQIRYEYNSLVKRITNPMTVVLIPDLGLYSSFNGRRIIEYIDGAFPLQYEEKLKIQEEKTMKEINNL